MKSPLHFFLPALHTRRLLIIAAMLSLSLCSCENKRDRNGDLGGMWQMLEWRDGENQVVKDKRSRIFYSVQLQLIRLRDYHDQGDYYQCYFTHTPDSLVIYHPTLYSAKDSLVSLSDLSRFGVPADGRFRIQVLNEDRLVLSSADTLTLVFRKY